MTSKKITIEYEWCGYESDYGLITVQKITREDFAKVFTKNEALALIEKLKETL